MKYANSILASIALLISGCGINEADFDKVHMGDRRETVIQALGNPDSMSGVEGPLFSGQQLVWKSGGRVYKVTLAMDRVIAKTIE